MRDMNITHWNSFGIVYCICDLFVFRNGISWSIRTLYSVVVVVVFE